MQFQEVTVAPTVDTSAYGSGDQIGTTLTVTGPSSGEGSGCRVEKLVVVDKAKQKSALKIWLFNRSTTPASADQAAADVTDANVLANCIGVITIAASDYADLANSSVATVNPNLIVKPVAGANAIYALVVSGGTPTYTAAADLALKFTFAWE
jgi:hypothetical protein